jgi:hypothetical protein
MRSSLILSLSGFVMLLTACSSAPLGASPGQDRYSAVHGSGRWTVVIRSGESSIDEIEIYGLVGEQPLTASGQSIRSLEGGAFEVDLGKLQLSSETSALVRNRGVKKIVFDHVGDSALRARISGETASGEDSELILNREQDRVPAGVRERWLYLPQRFGGGRF